MLRIRPGERGSTAGRRSACSRRARRASGRDAPRGVAGERRRRRRRARGRVSIPCSAAQSSAGHVAIGEDQHDLAAELAAARRSSERPQVRAGPRDADRDAAGAASRDRHSSGSLDVADRRRVAASTTSPTTTAGTPSRLERSGRAARRPPAAATTTIPSPPLNVARSSSSSSPPSAPNRRMTDGIGQRAGSSRAAEALGRAPAARCRAARRR